MKKVSKGSEPAKLAAFRNRNPHSEWAAFKSNKLAKQELQQKVKGDQGGLCAYCEINLKEADSSGEADFRVEHFHPKSDNSTPYNWHLDWQNLLGCCHGGSQSNVVESNDRFSSPDHSCDVPKADNDWDQIILNPISIPSSSCLFSFARADGSISVNHATCDQENVDKVKAQATIDNLRLDSPRLRRLRKATLDGVNASLGQLMQQGLSIEDARAQLAKGLLKKNSDGHWPRFFSSLRDYLGDAAEQQLNNIGYSG